MSRSHSTTAGTHQGGRGLDLKQVYLDVLASHGLTAQDAEGSVRSQTLPNSARSNVSQRPRYSAADSDTESVLSFSMASATPGPGGTIYGAGERVQGEAYLQTGQMAQHQGGLNTGQSQAVIAAMKSLRDKVAFLEQQRDRERAEAEMLRRQAGDAVVHARDQVDAARSELERAEHALSAEREELVATRERLFQETQLLTAEIESKRQAVAGFREEVSQMKHEILNNQAVSSELSVRLQSQLDSLATLNSESQARCTQVASRQESLQAEMERTEVELAQIASAIDNERSLRQNAMTEKANSEATLERLVTLNDDLMKKVGQVAAQAEQPPAVLVHEKPPRFKKKTKKRWQNDF